MPLLSPSQIAGMRATLNSTFSDECVIYRKTTTNVGGEESEEWTILATVPCRIAPLNRLRSGETGTTGGRIADESTHLITLAADTDVEEPDRIEADGEAYDVTLVRKRGSWELSRRVEVKESVEGIPEVGS